MPSAFFLLVYLRFSGFDPGDSAPPALGTAPVPTPALALALAPGVLPVPVGPAAPVPLAALIESLGPPPAPAAPTPAAGAFPDLGRFEAGGVTPPLASRLAASFCSLASSARSRFDMIPSFGGRPGPRRRAGCCEPSASVIISSFAFRAAFVASL